MSAPYCSINSHLRPGGVWVPAEKTNIAKTFEDEYERLKMAADLDNDSGLQWWAESGQQQEEA